MKDLFVTTSKDSSRFLLNGDLNQMSTQRTFLLSRGFEVLQNNVYPSIKQDDVKRALTLIWEQNIVGWWNYREKLEELGICTKEEFKIKINKA